MPNMLTHSDKIALLQHQIREQIGQPLSLRYSRGHSNTTRSKSYKKGCHSLSCGQLDQVLAIDYTNKKVTVEPRVTMDALVRATLAHGFIPLVVPEFKGITVGGAIMGAAAESTSHKWGIFHDSCSQLKFLDGKGNLVEASPTKNPELFYGISGSYGTFGLLVSAEINLIPATNSVQLTYHRYSDPLQALEKLQQLDADFVDGIIFAPDLAVIVEGQLTQKIAPKPSSAWFAAKVKENRSEVLMPLYDYLFRYDRGAFWMGNFLFSPSFLSRYIGQGILNVWPSKGCFTNKEIEKFKNYSFPNPLFQSLAKPLMQSQQLWRLLHKAEKWVQDRLIIQDFCIPTPQSGLFLTKLLKYPRTYPIWLCPIKGTHTAQFLAPHQGHDSIINFGVYGVPGYSVPMQEIITNLEQQTHTCGGRKVLYSRSYYDNETFWKIYSQNEYEKIRTKTHATGIWRELTEKVLSE